MAANADHPASCTDLASRVRASPLTHRSSAYTAWLSRMMRVAPHYWQAKRLWAGSYFAGSPGGAPIPAPHHYIEQQDPPA
jgi:REP element-mobilizing transposase RayT